MSAASHLVSHVCTTCGHSADWHGARAGTPPEACQYRGCECTSYVVVVTGRARTPDPRHDRDLYRAYCMAAEIIETGRDSSFAEAYELLMTEVARWWLRVTPP